MFSKKDFTFIVFFFFVARIKFIQGNLKNNEMYQSNLDLLTALLTRILARKRKKRSFELSSDLESFGTSRFVFLFLDLIEELLVNP
jgi:hypothetical protein